MAHGDATHQTILAAGGGMSGITAALEAAKCSEDVVLVEKPPLGGRTVQLYHYFPKLCHPTCGFEFNMPVAYCSQLMTVAYGGTLKETGLDGHVIRAKKLEVIAVKVVPMRKT